MSQNILISELNSDSCDKQLMRVTHTSNRRPKSVLLISDYVLAMFINWFKRANLLRIIWTKCYYFKFCCLIKFRFCSCAFISQWCFLNSKFHVIEMLSIRVIIIQRNWEYIISDSLVMIFLCVIDCVCAERGRIYALKNPDFIRPGWQ